MMIRAIYKLEDGNNFFKGCWYEWYQEDVDVVRVRNSNDRWIRMWNEEFKLAFGDIAIGDEVKTLVSKREFESGATRDTDTDKLDYEGFLSHSVLNTYAEYMHRNREMSDGSLRDSDNWQKGIPKDAYMKSMYRHFMDVWGNHRGISSHDDDITNLCALMFNVMGMLHEKIKEK